MRNEVVAIGIVLVILGLIAYAYTIIVVDKDFGGLVQDVDEKRPYRQYALPLIIIGGLLIIIGAFIPGEQKTIIREPAERRTVIRER